MYNKLKKTKSPKEGLRFLKAVEIQPKDDAYHISSRFSNIEWWYFDAIFKNGYSVHIGFRTYHIKKFGMVQSRINIYKNGKIISEELKIDFFSKFFIDPNFPIIKINDKTIVYFDKESYEKNKEWRYRINICINNKKVDLLFIGTTKGWKIETTDNCWVVPLPKAKVSGEIVINGEKIEIEGIGYHDHNWGYSVTTAMNNIGWYWGRISTETMNVTWAKIIQNFSNSDIIAVINKDNNNFYNVSPENIEITTKKNDIYEQGFFPREFDLKIKDESTNDFKINCDIKMNTIGTKYNRIFTIKYWRYHVKTYGHITIGNYTENLIDKPQIIELLKFKAKEVL